MVWNCIYYTFSLLSKIQVLACLFITEENSGSEKKETTSSTLSESVTVKRKIRNREELTEDECIDSEAYGNEHGERRVKQSTEKNLKAKVSLKKSLTKTGLSCVESEY